MKKKNSNMLTRQWPLRRYTLRLSQERNERDSWGCVSSSRAYFFFLINLFFERYGFCFLSRPQWGDANRFVLIQTHEALSRFSPTYELKILEIVFYINLFDLAYVTSYKNFHTSWVTIITQLPLRPRVQMACEKICNRTWKRIPKS